MREIVVATPIQLFDQDGVDPLIGDRMFEGLSEGVIRYNQEMMRSGLFPKDHPYSDHWKMVYDRDPISSGTFQVDNDPPMPIREFWATAYGSARRRKDDCDSNSHWLAAWYREALGVHATAAIYPSVIVETTKGPFAGRHVVVWVPLSKPIYTHAPWDSDKFIRTIVPGEGYIEDPSIALGMYYTATGERPLPPREPFDVDNRVLRRRAESLMTGNKSRYFQAPSYADLDPRGYSFNDDGLSGLSKRRS